MTLNFNNAPYYDDYDQTKGFLKILFKPGYAVQARELTQSQDILQNQISSFGSFVFKSGSQVLGGQITLDTNVTYLNLQSQFQNTAINLANFANSVITDAASNTVRASVIAVSQPLSGSINPPTLMVKYLTGVSFSNGALITVESGNTGTFAYLANTNSQGVGSCASLQDGIYFIDMSNINPTPNANANTVTTLTNGYFVRVPQQTIILDAYDNTPSYRVGLQISDSVVSVQSDSSLLDPALGASNYQAPGADRYIINAILGTRNPLSQDDSAFIDLLQVVNGNVQSIVTNPQLSQLNTVLAQRTYDQSGSFTVTPFRISLLDTPNNDIANANTQLYYAALGPGNAYVDGFEYQTVSKTYLNATRAQSTVNVSQVDIQTYFGNYINLDTINGEFNFTTLPLLDIHCVNWANVNTTSIQSYSNTLMGTARLRGFEYSTASNTANGLTYVYRASLFDVNTGSIMSVSSSAGSSNITFGSLFSPSDNAYIGLPINIPSTGDTRLITSYNGANRIATVSSNWSVIPNGVAFSILNNIQSAESLGVNGYSNFASANANINVGSKNTSNTYQYVSLGDTTFTPLLFPFPNSYVAQGLTSPSYQYRTKVASGQTLTPGSPLIINLSIPGDSSATFVSASDSGSDLITLNDFLVVTKPVSGTGQIIPMVASLGRSVATTSTTATFTLNSGDPTYTNVDIYASINTTLAAKTKTLVQGNTTTAFSSGGTSVGPATVYLTAGQIVFATPSSSNLKTPGSAQDIYISDVTNIVAIIDSGSLSTAVSSAMIQAAISGNTMPGSSVNITNNYTLFNGQKLTYYDHATITLNSGAPVPTGQVLVLVNYFTPSSTGGYFSVDSYPTYSQIPTFIPTNLATYYNLRDCIDFRPVRDAATTAYTFANAGTIFLPEPIPSNGFKVNYNYYLGRADIVTLDKGGNFNIIQGVPSNNPVAPNVPSKNMLLYTLILPPYTYYAANISVQMENNKRYTMKDIGKLEQRIQTLEYYNSLSQVEQQATNQTNPDSNGVNRPQYGLLVDSFVGSSVADVLNPDYFAAIDNVNQVLRAPFSMNNFPLIFNPSTSENYAQNGSIITLPYVEVACISQNAASRVENLNPFNLTVWNGTMQLIPDSDTWMSTQAAPAVTTNISGNLDSWYTGQPFATVWNNWQTVWTGVSTQTSTYTGASYVGAQQPGVYINSAHADAGLSAYQVDQQTTTSTTTTTTQDQVQTGIQYTLSADQITVPVGDNVVNVSVVPYIRNNYLIFVCHSLKPLDQVYSFFDSVNVTPYTDPHRLLYFTSNVQFASTDVGPWETIVDTDHTNGTNSAVVFISAGSNKVWIGNEKGIIVPGKTFIGQTSGVSAVVSNYVHTGGSTYGQGGDQYRKAPYSPGVTPTVTATTLLLQASASNVDNYYNGNTITVFSYSGNFVAVTSNIVSYNGASRIATVSPAWNLSLAANTNVNYHIGSMMTDDYGDICGGFGIPDPSITGIEFTTGSATFMITDDITGTLTTATTKATDTYTAQGTLDTTQEQYVTTTVPVLTTQTVSQTQVVTNSQTAQTVATNVVGYVDPVAQTFLVDNNIYPNGIFMTSVRVCFQSADKKLPVTLQIVPSVNGYPSSSTVIPFSQVTLSPNQVNVTSAPNLDDPNQYTEFTFQAPLSLLPGNEYAIVIKSNSNNYNLYTAAVGDTYLGSTRIVSSPPYAGVFFKSQNSSTWTAYQGESMMFRINKALFNNSEPFIATFYNPASNSVTSSIVPSNEAYLDVMYITNNDQSQTGTSLAYGFRGTGNTSRTLDSSYSPVVTNSNYYFGSRYVATPYGNTFFLQTTGSSNYADISPIIDTSRYSTIAIWNDINFAGLSNSNIVITNPGLGYNVSNTNIITVSGGGGSGAVVAIGSVNASGSITSLYIPSNQGGTGYVSTPNTSITTSGYSPSAQASFVISGETNKSGGNIVAKYMTRMASLSATQPAGDINVYLDVNIPSGTNVLVYYKIMSGEDNDTFANKPWNLMSLVGPLTYATTPNSFTTNKYVPGLDQYGNPILHVGYSTFNSFQYFAVKIDMISNNPTIVPQCQNLRIYALPSG